MEITFCVKKTFVSIYFYIKKVNLIMKACYCFFLLLLTLFYFHSLLTFLAVSFHTANKQMDRKQDWKRICVSEAEYI